MGKGRECAIGNVESRKAPRDGGFVLSFLLGRGRIRAKMCAAEAHIVKWGGEQWATSSHCLLRSTEPFIPLPFLKIFSAVK
jgi:hypothetical protein